MKRPEITDILSLSVQKHINTKNDTKIQLPSPAEREQIAENVGLNSPLENMVNISVNAMLSWKSVLKQRIEDAEIK